MKHPAPRYVISSRRSLLQQSLWFYWLTALVGIVALCYHFYTGGFGLIVMFFLMLLVCLALPFANFLTRFESMRRILFPRKLKSTKEGKWYIIFVFAVAAAALNSGDNLLYLILAMMLSFVVTSGILSENVLKGLKLTRIIPLSIFAGEEFEIGMKVENVKKTLSSYSIILEDPDMEKHSELSTTSYIFHLPPGQNAKVSYKAKIVERGSYILSHCEIATRFPFDFFIKSMERHSDAELVVFPRRGRLSARFLQQANQELSKKQRLSGRAGGLEEFHSLREYRQGDNPRKIHWRSSARTGHLVIKEFERQKFSQAVILFDNLAGEDDLPAYEKAISFITTLANELVIGKHEVRFWCPSLTQVLTCEENPKQLLPIFKSLALLEPVPPEVGIAWPSFLTNLPPRSLIFCVSGTRNSPLEREAAKHLAQGSILKTLCAADPDFGNVFVFDEGRQSKKAAKEKNKIQDKS